MMEGVSLAGGVGMAIWPRSPGSSRPLSLKAGSVSARGISIAPAVDELAAFFWLKKQGTRSCSSIETLDWNSGGRALVARRFGPLFSQLASFVLRCLSGDSRRRFASRHDGRINSEPPRPQRGRMCGSGRAARLFDLDVACLERCLVRISGAQ